MEQYFLKNINHKERLKIMYKNFDEMLEKALQLSQKRTISIAAAADKKIIQVTKEILKMNLCHVILVDEKERIEKLAKEENVDLSKVTMIDADNITDAALKAVEQVS